MDALAAADISLFEGFRLDRRGGVLFRRDQQGVFTPIAIGRRALDVLGVLVERPGDLVSREDIIEAVWPGTTVEDSNLNVQIAALRRLLDDGRAEGSCIQTVSGRGYRFVAPVTLVERAAAPTPALSTGNGSDGLMTENEQAQGSGLLRQIGGMAPASRSKGRHPLWGGAMATVIGALILVVAGAAWNWRSLWSRDALKAPRLSIVVLPFTNLSNDPEQQYFADGLTDDLTTDLSRLAGMFVISRNTAFTYRNKPVDTKQIGRELGVRYMLQGSVQRAGKRVRVTAQLINAETDSHAWAERFAGDISDLFALQDEITSRLANALGVEMIAAEAARPIEHSDALDYILRGRATRHKPNSRDVLAEAISLYERALSLDPGSVEAQSLLAAALVGRLLDFGSSSEDADIKRAEELATKAVAASPSSALAHYAKADVLRVQRRCAEAIPEYETALLLNRNLVAALAAIGRCKIHIGPIDGGIAAQEQAIRLSPRDPLLWSWYFRIGEGHLLLSRVDDAILWLEKARNANQTPGYIHAYLAAAYALKSETERAAAELGEARKLDGEGSWRSVAKLRAGTRYEAPNIRALAEATYYAGLRKAGMPEE